MALALNNLQKVDMPLNKETTTMQHHSEFKFHSYYYIHYQINILGKGMNPPYLPNYVLNSTTTVFL